MKKLSYILGLMLLAVLLFSGCDKDNDKEPISVSDIGLNKEK